MPGDRPLPPRARKALDGQVAFGVAPASPNKVTTLHLRLVLHLVEAYRLARVLVALGVYWTAARFSKGRRLQNLALLSLSDFDLFEAAA